MRFTSTARRAAFVAGVVTAVVALVAPTAQAVTPAAATAVTKTTLTQYDSYDSTSRYGATNKRTISGTASGLSGSTVDIVCLNVSTGQIDRTLQRGVTVTAGKWSTDMWTNDISGYRCRVVAVETGVSPAGDTDAARLTWGKAFKSLAPFYQVFERYDNYYVTGGSPLKYINFSSYLYSATPSSEITMYGTDQGGIYRFQPRDGAGNKNYGPFGAYYGSSTLNSTYRLGTVNRTSGNTAGLLVDNVQAFTNYTMSGSDDNYGPAASVQTSYKVDAKTGAITVTDVMPLFKCTKGVAGTFYDGASSCPDYKTTKLNVNWTQVKTVNAAGNTIKVVNTFASLDKKAHTVRLIWNDRFINSAGYRYGTSGAFSALGSGFSTDEKTNVTGYAVKSDGTKPSAFDNAIGQVVFSAKGTTWGQSGFSGVDMYAMFTVAVKAGGAGSISAAYTIVTDDSKAATQIGNALK